MKILKKVLIGVVILLVVVIVAIALFLGQIIKTGVETVGPQVAGVTMTLDKASVNLLKGDVNLKGLIIGNPEGFKTPSLMELGQLVIDIDTGSLMTDTIVIKQIHIDAPQITYERALKASNLSTLQDNLASDKPKEEQPKEEKPKSDKPAKKVIIEDFLFENGKINVSITALGGKKITIPLPPIHLENIGKESDGASTIEVINEIMGAITKAVGQAVASSANLAGDAVGAVGDLAGDAAGAAAGVIGEGAGAAAGAIGEGAGAATDAAKNIGGAAGDAAKGAADGLKKLGGGLFKKD